MTVDAQPPTYKAAGDFNAAATDAHKTKRAKRSDGSPLVVRVTSEERQRLEELAAGMTLSDYVRACVFGAEASRRKKRPKNAVEDKKAAAEALALLGQSRIASNLNQLAYHANLGVLDFGPQECGDIAEGQMQAYAA